MRYSTAQNSCLIFILFSDKQLPHIANTEKLTELPTAATKNEQQHRRKTLSSHRATVTDDVSKLGCISVTVTFLDLGAKVNETYYCDLLLSQ